MLKKIRECFKNALKDDRAGKKHRGLLKTAPDMKTAKGYLEKAGVNLKACEYLRKERMDYKLPEEWYYTKYYCVLALLSAYWVESRNQKRTALFLTYLKEKGEIDIDQKDINSLTVHSQKGKTSDVDERQEARYGPSLRNEAVITDYDKRMKSCREFLDQVEEHIFSGERFAFPKEFLLD
jgi:hypothetical protein